MPDSQVEFRFGYAGAIFDGLDALVEVAGRAESSGFETLSVPDLPGALSPLIALAAVARATTTIGVATLVLNTGLWDPLTVSRELATLDQVSGGRLQITLGSGIPQPALEGIVPPTRDARFERLCATVDAIKSAFDAPGIGPGFVGRPRLLIAGTSDRTLRLAAEHADGFIIAAVPPVPKVELPRGQLVLPEPVASKAYMDRLRGYAAGRADPLELGTAVQVIVTDDAQAAAEDLAKVHAYLTAEQIRSSPKILIGTVGEIADQILDRRGELGLTHYVMRGGPPEVLATIVSRVREQG